MTLRLASADDAAAIAIAHRRAMRESLSFLPDMHGAEQDLAYFAQRFLPANTVWVAEREGRVVGYLGFEADWINHLYLLPEAQGQGLGLSLLAKALADGRTRRLWTFQQNARARQFYEMQGFVMARLSDGAGNEERMPDALYEWRARGKSEQSL